MSPQTVGDLDVAQQQKCALAKQAAETMLRVLGGGKVFIRVPLTFAEAGDDAQLGKSGRRVRMWRFRQWW